MRPDRRAIASLTLCYLGWTSLWGASFTGAIDSTLSRRPLVWGGVGALSVALVMLAQTDRARARLATLRGRLRGWQIALCCALFVLGATGFIAHETFGATPRVQDEVNYSFMGKMFAAGHLWLEGLPANEFFSYRFVLTEDRIYSLFQPGWPALLALGHLAGCAWLLGPICSAAATFLLYLVTKELFDERHALWATAMMSCAQAWWFQGASMMSHMFACSLGLAALYCAARALRGSEMRKRALCALGAGALLGALFTVRAGTAVALALPVIAAGAYLAIVPKKRLPWRLVIAFAVGLASMGSLQLLYNALLSGHALIFPQDHYFNLTEPIERCHRLGLGAGIGCPYEHGPDLGRDGFTVERAWEVTSIRLKQLRWDMFGTGVALWTGLFALSSRQFWRPKLFALTLCLSVIGLYFFYYYHGNLYGARYYFEITPYIMMLLTSGWLSLIALIDKTCGPERLWLRRALTAGVIGLTLLLPAYQLTDGAKEKHDFYSGGWEFAKALERAERASELERAVIIAPNAPRAYWAGFAQNRGDLAGERLYVRDWGEAMNARLKAYYPDRQFYRPRFLDGEVTFVPITLKDEGKIVIEGEAMFPVPERSGGYAVESIPQGVAEGAREPRLSSCCSPTRRWAHGSPSRCSPRQAGSYHLKGTPHLRARLRRDSLERERHAP